MRMAMAVFALACALAVGGLVVARYLGRSDVTVSPPGGATTAVYMSDRGERLTARFDLGADTVTLVLPGGRTVTLPRAMSASGVRYSNGRETFWEHQGEGSYWVGEELVFRGNVAGSK